MGIVNERFPLVDDFLVERFATAEARLGALVEVDLEDADFLVTLSLTLGVVDFFIVEDTFAGMTK